jgi:hypothetical protein
MVPKGLAEFASRKGAGRFWQDMVRGKIDGLAFRPLGYDRENPWTEARDIIAAGPEHPGFESELSFLRAEGLDGGVRYRGVRGRIREGDVTGALYFVPDSAGCEKTEWFLLYN